ncbi:hypothetical protein BRARA_G01026 [Brassica rapa]|uniref:Uncharacterized protein n=1 Tax=Brassica campestris TaxID=3711 RepID=A0A397YLJ0_BRACM|nr:hypothetical protein BRARA_G01026 [Brassica rapa]
MIKSCRDAQLDSHETSYLVADEEFLPIKERELRIACTLAHMEREGGISPRLSPLAQVRDAWNLLTRAGFSLPGVDFDEYVVKYKSGKKTIPLFVLLHHCMPKAFWSSNFFLFYDLFLLSAGSYRASSCHG